MHHEPQTYADLQNTGNAQSQLVLLAIARHADWDSGACFPAVRTLARMAKCSEKTVRRHLKRLAADGFITIAPRRYEAGHQAPSLLTLDGYAEWVASVRAGGMVAPPRRAKRYPDAALGADDDPPLDGGSDPCGDGSADPAGSGQIDQGGSGQIDRGGLVKLTRGSGHLLTRGSGQQVSTQGTFTEPSLEQDSPLTPIAARRGGSDLSESGQEHQRGPTGSALGVVSDSPLGSRPDAPAQCDKGAALCQAAEAAGAPHQVVAHLLRPVLTQRRFSAAGDKVAELVALARSARDLPEPALAAAARLLLAADVATLKPERIRRAIAAAKVGGAMVTVRKGTAQWQRWVEHLAVIDPGQAAAMARFETWLVRSEWPGSAPAGTRGLQDGETSPPASASGRLAERESDAPARRAAP